MKWPERSDTGSCAYCLGCILCHHSSFRAVDAV